MNRVILILVDDTLILINQANKNLEVLKYLFYRSGYLAWKGLVRKSPFSKNEDRADTVYKLNGL